MVYLEAPELHIRMIWGTQFMTLSFAQPTPEDGKVLYFAQKNLHQPDPSNGGGTSRVARPRRSGVTAGDGYGGADSAPRPGTFPDTRRHPTAREGIHTTVLPCPPLPGAPADGLPIPIASNLIAHDARKGQHGGDDPTSVTFP